MRSVLVVRRPPDRGWSTLVAAGSTRRRQNHDIDNLSSLYNFFFRILVMMKRDSEMRCVSSLPKTSVGSRTECVSAIHVVVCEGESDIRRWALV